MPTFGRSCYGRAHGVLGVLGNTTMQTQDHARAEATQTDIRNWSKQALRATWVEANRWCGNVVFE